MTHSVILVHMWDAHKSLDINKFEMTSSESIINVLAQLILMSMLCQSLAKMSVIMSAVKK